MSNYEFIIPVEPGQTPDEWELPWGILDSGWTVTPASQDQQRRMLLLRKVFSSEEDGWDEIRRSAAGDAAVGAYCCPVERDPIPDSNASLLDFAPPHLGPHYRDAPVMRIAAPTVSADAVNGIFRTSLPIAVDGIGPVSPSSAPGDGTPITGGVVAMTPDIHLEIIKLYWEGLDPAVKKTAAKEYFDSQRELEKIQSRSAAWLNASDEVLLHAAGPSENASLAAVVLRARNGLLSDARQGEMEQARVAIAQSAARTATSLQESIDQWTALAKAAPKFIGVTLVFAIVIIVGAFQLVRSGHMDGYMFSLAIFVSAVFVVSPATLLLLGRPLQGIDNASLTAEKAGDAKDKTGDDAAPSSATK